MNKQILTMLPIGGAHNESNNNEWLDNVDHSKPLDFLGTMICNRDLTSFDRFIEAGEGYEGPLPTHKSTIDDVSLACEMVMAWHSKEPKITIYGSFNKLNDLAKDMPLAKYVPIQNNRYSFKNGKFELNPEGEYEYLIIEASDIHIKKIKLIYNY